ncbi:MAG TPA: DUF2269 family protein [Nitriliruptorales bacterium]|nr:DUF2269 family protein [Nitriliruptorales bacterium]
MYQWWLFLHLAGIFGFLLAHGASVAITFRLRKERDPRRISALLELSRSSVSVFYASLGLLVAAGIVLGFIPGAPGTWWGEGWIWTAIVVLAAVSAAMGALATPYYRRVERVARARAGGSEAVTDEDLARLLTNTRPVVVAGLGFGGLLVILWLMVLKPF